MPIRRALMVSAAGVAVVLLQTLPGELPGEPAGA
jgi:hypothetical protein